jgi:release factor glutamine methyltransferase
MRSCLPHKNDDGATTTLRGLEVTSIATARRSLAQTFRAAGLDAPALDARLLVGHALGLDHAAFAAAAERPLAPAEIACIEAFAARRLVGEPVARIVGMKEFWGLPLLVTPAVLVPRPDSETLVAAALTALDARKARARAVRFADLGTGSGALLLALLSELPHAYGVGTDRDPCALATARANAERLGLTARAGFVASDYGTALTGGFELVIANPPYVCTRDIESLAPEVRNFDPRGALDGGPDGLAAYRAIAADAGRMLAPGAPLLVEVGKGQSRVVSDLFERAGLAVESAPQRDLAGIARVITARRLV